MTESSDGVALARALRAKAAQERDSTITGLKLSVFGVQLTLIGGFVPELRPIIFIGGVVGALGLLVR
jgi:hypothetical protein